MHIPPLSKSKCPVSQAIYCRSGGRFRSRAGSLWRPSALGDGHKAVAEDEVLQRARRRGGGGGDRVAGDPLRKGHGTARVGLAGEAVAAMPILVVMRRSGNR